MTIDEAMRHAATEAQNEAKAYTDRGLLEAIYILIRRNELMQQNAAGIAHDDRPTTVKLACGHIADGKTWP